MLPLLKGELLSVLADVYDEASWSDGTLEEALRQALVDFNPYAMLREVSFVLLESGYEHDLSSLGAYEITFIGYPWSDGALLADVAVPWRLISLSTFRCDTMTMGAGEVVRVQYRPSHTIQFLDGGEETTFWAIERARFLLLAARAALRLRILYYTNSGTAEDLVKLPALAAAIVAVESAFVGFEAPAGGSSGFLVWGPMGQDPCVSW